MWPIKVSLQVAVEGAQWIWRQVENLAKFGKTFKCYYMANIFLTIFILLLFLQCL